MDRELTYECLLSRHEAGTVHPGRYLAASAESRLEEGLPSWISSVPFASLRFGATVLREEVFLSGSKVNKTDLLSSPVALFAFQRNSACMEILS